MLNSEAFIKLDDRIELCRRGRYVELLTIHTKYIVLYPTQMGSLEKRSIIFSVVTNDESVYNIIIQLSRKIRLKASCSIISPMITAHKHFPTHISDFYITIQVNAGHKCGKCLYLTSFARHYSKNSGIRIKMLEQINAWQTMMRFSVESFRKYKIISFSRGSFLNNIRWWEIIRRLHSWRVVVMSTGWPPTPDICP